MRAPRRHPLIRADLQGAYDWYEDTQPGLGARCRVNLNRFPYGIFYVIKSDGVWILAVLHGSRDSKGILDGRRRSFPR